MGLRILTLAVGNIDFERPSVKIQRSFVEGEVYSRNTDPSESILPLDPNLAAMHLQHRAFPSASGFTLTHPEPIPTH